MLRGHERQAVADIASLEVATPFDAEKDVMFYKPTAKFLMADLRENQFVFYFPHDGHLPLIAPGEVGTIRKLVVKIAAK
jgi:YhcH/YjgK/YiaL family protein